LLPGLDGNGGRLVIDAICYVADDGIERRNLPAGHGIHWKTLHAIFARWGRDGFTIALHDDLREEVRGAEGRERERSAAAIDSQSVRVAETVSADSRGREPTPPLPPPLHIRLHPWTVRLAPGPR
jgi:transposase